MAEWNAASSVGQPRLFMGDCEDHAVTDVSRLVNPSINRPRLRIIHFIRQFHSSYTVHSCILSPFSQQPYDHSPTDPIPSIHSPKHTDIHV